MHSECESDTLCSTSAESLTKVQKKKCTSFSLRSPPPSQHLKKILENYPEGSQIFIEALQNADDAKASVFRIILDERIHRSSHSRFDRFMGPAILFHNDSVFQPSDWTSLQNMFESSKISVPGKIGKFGMGSRSYFHITDVLTLVSGSRAAFLDPDWCLTENGGAAFNLPCDSFDPFDDLFTALDNVLGFSKKTNNYQGTLFRLPLRMGRWARASSFAPYEYTTSKALGYLHKFRKEAADCLLFLQSIKKIELWRWPESEDDLLQIYSCSITAAKNDSGWTRDTRYSLRKYLESQNKFGLDLKSTYCQADASHFPEIFGRYVIEEVEYLGGPNIDTGQYDVCIKTSDWLLAVRLISNPDFLPYLHYTKILPIVGIGLMVKPPHIQRKKEKQKLPIKNENKSVHKSTSQSSDSPSLFKSSPVFESESSNSQISWAIDSSILTNAFNRKGKTFSFLPLPDVNSGLPIHIHATFQLTDNRRSLWLALDNTDGQAQKWSEWNHLLISYGLAELYAKVILAFSQITNDALQSLNEEQLLGKISFEDYDRASQLILQNYYSMWPEVKNTSPAFQCILKSFIMNIKDQKVLIRQPQNGNLVARRLAGYNEFRSMKIKARDSDKMILPPYRPCDASFLILNDTEAHIFKNKKNVLYEAVAQCQLLGHRVILIDDFLLPLFDNSLFEEKTNLFVEVNQKKKNFKNGMFQFINLFDIYSNVLFPHWLTIPSRELQLIPHFVTLMLFLCKILGRGSDKYIIRFRDICSSLPFIPTKFPGIDYDDQEILPLRTPSQCFDPSLNGFKIGQLSQPDNSFRSPDVLRVLRLWGLKQHLGWTEIAQEAVSRICVVANCQSYEIAHPTDTNTFINLA